MPSDRGGLSDDAAWVSKLIDCLAIAIEIEPSAPFRMIPSHFLLVAMQAARQMHLARVGSICVQICRGTAAVYFFNS